MRRFTIAALLIVVVAGSAWYVVAAPRSVDAYRDRAAETASTLSSQVVTARLWTRAVDDGETLRPSAKVGIEDTERRAESAAAKFAHYDPPPGSERVRADLTRLATETTDLLASLRIAAHRDEWEAVVAAGGELERLARDLEAFRRRAEP